MQLQMGKQFSKNEVKNKIKDNREIKHHVLRQTANVSLQSIFFTFPPII